MSFSTRLPLSGNVHMPSLNGATAWLNSSPLTPADLRGHVVLVDFWTLTCINWLRTQPYIRAWSQAYRSDGLVVVAVHTPEFSFEHDVELVRLATQERGMDYPVAVDDDYAIWGAFANRYWPALYFVDADGIIRDQHAGEGRYEQSERVLQRLLGIDRDWWRSKGSAWRQRPTGTTWDTRDLPRVPARRAFRIAGPPRVGRQPHVPAARAVAPEPLGAGRRVDGRSENAVLDRAEGSIACRFSARDAHLVLSPGAAAQIPFRVTSMARPRGRQPVSTSTRTGTGCSGTGACTSSSASTSASATGHCRSRSSSPAPRRTRSPSASRMPESVSSGYRPRRASRYGSTDSTATAGRGRVRADDPGPIHHGRHHEPGHAARRRAGTARGLRRRARRLPGTWLRHGRGAAGAGRSRRPARLRRPPPVHHATGGPTGTRRCRSTPGSPAASRNGGRRMQPHPDGRPAQRDGRASRPPTPASMRFPPASPRGSACT